MSRTVTITFANGSSHVYQNVPDTVTPDQVEQRAGKDFPGLKVASLDGGARAAPAPTPESYSQKVARTKKALAEATGTGLAGVARSGVAALENTAAMGTGIVGDIVGAGTSLATQDPKRGEAVRQALTYQPRTAAGKADQAFLGALASPVGEVMGAPQRYLESHGHPIASQVLTAAEDVGGGEEGALGKGAKTLTRADEASEAVRAGERSGFVLPVSQSQPGIISKLSEAVAGKVHTQQALSGINTETGNALVRKGLGLRDDAPLTPETMAEIRREAGRDYEAVKAVKGNISISDNQALNDRLDEIAASRKGGIRSTAKDDPIMQAVEDIRKAHSFTAEQGLTEIRNLRDEADKAFRAGDKSLGGNYKAIASALEDRIGDYLEGDTRRGVRTPNAPRSLIGAYRTARKRIAQSYDVEDALDGAGNVDLRRLGKGADRMTGELGEAARFGKSFPKYGQPPKATGSTLPSSLVGAAATGGLGALAGEAHGHALAGAAAAQVGRMVLQKLTTTKAGQRVLRAADQAARKTVRTGVRAAGALLPLGNEDAEELTDEEADNQAAIEQMRRARQPTPLYKQ